MEAQPTTYSCAGLLLLPEERQRQIIDGDEDPEATRLALQEEHGVSLPTQREAEEDWMYRLRIARARRRCGADLTALFTDLPADGLEHALVCPACGNVIMAIRYPEEG